LARSIDANRRDLIVDAIREAGFGRTSDLSSRFGVSSVTIRHDIDALSALGRVQRTYGGAIATPDGLDTPFALRSAQNRDAKVRIGIAAAATVRPGETILLDSGTTVLEVARRLPERADITVVTGALNVAMEAAAREGVTVIVCGGKLNSRTLSTADAQYERQLSQVYADRLFLGTYGVDLERGLCERSHDIAEVKRALMRAARQVTLVCDASKFDSTAPIAAAELRSIDGIITDASLSKRRLARLARTVKQVMLV
jgi:DeoR/GlpR family transcriptional regulator of sugar metabolism